MENTKIMTIDGYEFELVYIDSTHFKAKNLSIGNNPFIDYVVYHIGQFMGTNCYDEINNWLHSQN
jgi:hypothetical protein